MFGTTMLFIGDFGTDTLLAWMIILILFSMIYVLLAPQMMGMQGWMFLRQTKKAVRELEEWAMQSRRIALKSISRYGRPRRDIAKELDNFLEFFAIEPVSDDPVGVLNRLEHILDVRKKRFEGIVKHLAPKSDPDEAANLEMTLEGAIASYTLFRIVRHLIMMAEKTKSMQLAMLLQMQMPILKEYAKAYLDATETFSKGKPIGDGFGAMVATKLAGKAKWREPVKDTVYAETEIEGRRVFVIKAKGPGGRVGKPGEIIKRLCKRRKIDRIIMVDAALKLEGEKSGQIIEGVGAAIGGPGVEKYKVEEIATKRKIPVDAVVAKEGFKEAIGPLDRRIAKAVDAAVERVKKAIRERTKKGDSVIVAGIGNTIGIGQDPDQLPTKFPSRREKEGLESDRFLFQPS